MRHGVSFRKLGRDRLHRSSLLKNLATALIKHERIVTTLAKGKELRRVGDRVSVCMCVVYTSLCDVIVLLDDNFGKER